MKKIKVKNKREVPKNFTGIVKYRFGKAQIWYRDGNIHRENRPAVVYPDGEVFWWQNGKLHRLDGPAAEWNDGKKEYWILGEILEKSQFEIFRIMWERTLLEKTEDLMRAFIKLARLK